MADEVRLLCDRLLEQAKRQRATDVHLDPLMDGYLVRFRIDGVLHDHQRYDRATGIKVVNQFKTEAGVDPGALLTPRVSRLNYRFDGQEVAVRFTFAPCLSGQKLAIRILDPSQVTQHIEDLGMDETGLDTIREWLAEIHGMILVAGPTGSGKTTTLYALLHELAECDRHILTIEDPVEYEIDRINQIQVDRRNGLDFADGVRAMLRMDADYMMVGEIREPESALVSARAAVAGHVLLSTIHARYAVSVVTALRNFGLSDHQIAVSLSVVVNQRLVRKLCGECARESEVTAVEREWLERRGLQVPEAVRRAAGCEACQGHGYFGRTGVFEIWRPDKTDYEMLLAGADEHTLWRKLSQAHHRTVLDHALEKVRAGLTTLAEVRGFGETVPNLE